MANDINSRKEESGSSIRKNKIIVAAEIRKDVQNKTKCF